LETLLRRKGVRSTELNKGMGTAEGPKNEEPKSRHELG
jgi:hypothetical protein